MLIYICFIACLIIAGNRSLGISNYRCHDNSCEGNGYEIIIILLIALTHNKRMITAGPLRYIEVVS